MKKRIILLLSLVVILAFLSLSCSLTGGNEENSPPVEDEPAQSEVEEEPEERDTETNVILGDRVVNDAGGFSFAPIPDYSLEMDGGMVNMLAPGADPDNGPVISMIGATTIETTNEELFGQLQTDGGGMSYGEPESITVSGVEGLISDVHGNQGGVDLLGKVVLVMVTPTQQFILLAGSPEEGWEALEPIFEAVLASIEFFEPVAAAPALSISPGWYVYSNANVVRDIAVYDGVAYTATLGGGVAWDLAYKRQTKYTTLAGMGHISANAITVCDIPDTRIIVGTLTGLSFFDPATHTWDTHPITPIESLVDTSRIDRLFCDTANNRLLIGYNGLGILNLKTGEWQQYTRDAGLTWDGITDIAVSGSDIWVASGYNGISRIRNGQVTVFNEAGGMPDETASALAAAPDGTLWVGTASGLAKFNGSSWTLYDRTSTPGMVGDINEIEIAPDSRIWVASAPWGVGGLCLFNPATNTCDTVADETSGRSILALALDDGGTPLYGTSNGLYRYDGASFESFKIQDDQLASNFIDSIAGDAQGMLWFGTDSGLQQLDPAYPDEPWATYRENEGVTSPGGNWGKQILPMADGTLWVVMGNGEVSRLRNGEWTVFEDFYSYDAIAVDESGQVWLGDDGNGITVIDDNGNVLMSFTESEGLPSSDVRALLSTGNAVWIGTTNGLARYQDGTLETVLASGTAGLSSAYFLRLADLGDGSILIGNFTDVMKWDGSQLTTLISLPMMDSNARLTEMEVAADGHIYIGTSRGLFDSSDGTNWQQLTTADGLPTNYISALYADQFGTLWVGGGGSNFDGGGILRIVP